MTQKNGGAAFPNELDDGMSLRDYFAGQALQGLLANKGLSPLNMPRDSASKAYSMADAMLNIRDNKR